MDDSDPELDDDWGSGSGSDDDWGSDNDDMAGDGFGFGKQYKVLDWKELRANMEEVVQSTSETLGIDTDLTGMILRLNHWNTERIIDPFLNDRASFLEKSGLDSFGQAEPLDAPFECRICCNQCQPDDGLSLGCQHWFCKECWRLYLEDRINSKGKECVTSLCPMFPCSIHVPDSVVPQILSGDSLDKYLAYIVRSFVEDNRRLKWCPAARCDRAIKGDPQLQTVECKCKTKFCFRCSEEAHEPADCKQLQTWLEKCRNESETAHWIIANTRKCPKCRVRIEKNKGCNHMTCRSCKYEFCWVCDGPWSEHGTETGGFYKCNKYDPKSAVDKEKGASAVAEAKLNRYLHYYQRYHNHDQAKKFADKQIKATEERMKSMQDSASDDITWVDVEFLQSATEQVFECRRVLKYTYVFAYYLNDGPEKELFEFLQQQLEASTEKLSELSESPLEDIDRTQVVHYTGIVQKFLTNLLDGVNNGLTTEQ